jgi:hypothetical protein
MKGGLIFFKEGAEKPRLARQLSRVISVTDPNYSAKNRSNQKALVRYKSVAYKQHFAQGGREGKGENPNPNRQSSDNDRSVALNTKSRKK